MAIRGTSLHGTALTPAGERLSRSVVDDNGVRPRWAVPQTQPPPDRDGKFSLWEAGKNLLSGIFAPVKHIIQKPLLSLAVIGATVGAAMVFPPLVPVLLAAGVGFGGAQLTYGTGKLVYHSLRGEYDDMERSFKNIGEGASALGLSLVGIRQHYRTMGLQNGVTQSFKDSMNLAKEIFTTGKLPQEHTVVLMTTTNKQKMADLGASINQNGDGKVKVLSVTDDAAKTQLRVSSLAADESVYGNTYAQIAKGKAGQHGVKELLDGRLQNMDNPALNGKTLSQAFPGRRILVVADDSGFEMPIAASQLRQFKAKLRERGMSPRDIDFFVNKNHEQGITGLERLADGRVELMGVKSHPNLETLARRMNFVNAKGQPDMKQAEAMLAGIMKEMNPGGEFSFHSAVGVRNVLSSFAPEVRANATRGVITAEGNNPLAAVTDDFPLPHVVKIAEGHTLAGTKLSQAPRAFLSRSQAAGEALTNVIQTATREHLYQSATAGALVQQGAL